MASVAEDEVEDVVSLVEDYVGMIITRDRSTVCDWTKLGCRWR
jgi:hypothetical protein